ncbi:MAG TPA: NAD-dependent epimerase/dehydratase family protein [Candidatus Sulfotelmatobacter sp.]|jgi:nucleoside-diphosphate-sugar epimerase|nr:NAD-dependent epimerase/dehydratase family protein [Candidatus Sulfotelmatobacter sp.]
MSNTKILVTGAFGQIGSELVQALQKKYGKDSVVALGHVHIPSGFTGIVERIDITNTKDIKNLIEKYKITTIYHLVSLLSAKGENDPSLTWRINMDGLKLILDIAAEKNIQVFWPSSIAAFGPTTPQDNTPQKTVLEPTTMYGVTKVAGELLCHYYYHKYGVDVRSLRYPGLISWKAEPGGGTTDYAVAIFYEAIKSGLYTCFVNEDTVLPMMYMDDAIDATIQLMQTDSSKLTIRTSYNIAAISFSVKQLAEEINKHITVAVTYKPDQRQKIADSWPKSIDDSVARKEWGWKHAFDLPRMTEVMLQELKKKLEK